MKMSVARFAAKTGVPRRTVSDLITTGIIPSRVVNGVGGPQYEIDVAVLKLPAARMRKLLRTEYVSVSRLAETIGVSRWTLQNWARAGKVDAVRIGRTWRATRASVVARLRGA